MNAFQLVGTFLTTLTPLQWKVLRQVAATGACYGLDFSAHELAVARGLAASDMGLLDAGDGCMTIPAASGTGFLVQSVEAFTLTPLGQAVVEAGVLEEVR